jgi:NADH dehydrogenase/NADH:ubiquinone oxidoreductase subunit G
MSSKTEIDYLDENPEFVLKFDRAKKEFRQNYWVVSFVSPDNVKNTNLRLVKCHGIFETREDADNHAKNMREINPHFDIYVGDVGKWLGFDPSWDSCEDVVYKEKEMQDFMRRTLENREHDKNAEAKRVMEERNKNIKERVEQSKKPVVNYDNEKVSESKKRIREKLKKKQEINKDKSVEDSKDGSNYSESKNFNEKEISQSTEEIVIENDREKINPGNIKVTIKDKIDESLDSLEEKFAKMKN